ncbi:unnamed protein product [Adineta steineri]|uniref:Tetratricopeptide repeat protein n=2 Tax=Adineta steineri TaxID=433720 RepID=A0A813R1W5_9BILA|nr:unnamed protein product [Adineta steineri]CAF1459041.1 unnamed protein product [Adineta steineri]CAF3801643.1 unnamed protein product [Adineta steineri]CAF4083657.1 unnamed protein product [Adineta steineri]
MLQVKGVFTNTDSLVNQLTNDQRLLERTDDNVAISIYNQSTSHTTSPIVERQRTTQNAKFLYFQMLIEVLLNRLPYDNEKSKQELIEIWKQKHSDGSILFQEFQRDYRSEKTIYWYTRGGFLSETINAVLRDNDIDILLAMRSFIIDLYKRLTELHRKQFGDKQSSIFRVYRGQSLPISELDLIRNSIGGFISINNFLSTSTDIDVALGFAAASKIADDLTHCLLQIDIDPRVASTAFASIKDESYYKRENEVLINLGSICRVETVEYDQQRELSLITVTLSDLDNYALKGLLEQEKKSIGKSITSLPWLLYRQGDYPRSTKYYQAALNDSTASDMDRALCNRGLGLIAGEKKEFDKQIHYRTNERDLFKKLNPLGYMTDIGQAQTAIGEAYVFKREFEKALGYLQKSLVLLLDNHFGRANTFKVIANLYDEKGEYRLALQSYMKALDIYQQHLDENDFNFARLYSDIGLTYGKVRDFQSQLKYYHKAREIFLKSSHPDHQQIATIDDNIQRAIEQQQLFETCSTS